MAKQKQSYSPFFTKRKNPNYPPWHCFTAVKCKKCGEFYEPDCSLEHICKKNKIVIHQRKEKIKMSTCKDCFNENLCSATCGVRYYGGYDENVEKKCRHFKDKSKIVELPVAVGETVYALAEPCGGCECFNNLMKAEYIERCKHCEKTEIIPLKFSLDLYDEVGKTVFTSKEEAEKALEDKDENENNIKR